MIRMMMGDTPPVTWLRSPVLANFASAREKEASFMISPINCLVSMIFLRMLRNFNWRASAFFFSSL